MGRLDDGLWAYITTRSRLAYQLLTGVSAGRRLRRPDQSWDEIIDFAFHFADGYLFPLQVPSEIKQALEKIEAAKPRTLLEIGTAGGGTLFMLSRAASDGAHLLSLDLPHGRWGGGYNRWKTHVFRRLMVEGQRADFIRLSSHTKEALSEVKRLLGGASLDVLFIDGDHSYEGVRCDFEMYSPLVRPGGLVVLHDIAEHRAESGCGVRAFWEELRPTQRAIEIVESPEQGWAGIGIVLK